MQYVIGLIRTLLELVFPLSADALRVKKMSLSHACMFHVRVTNENIFYLFSYQEQNTRVLIHEAKFHYNGHALHFLATSLNHYVSQHPQDCVIIPIPLSKRRLHERGYNQVEEIVTRSLKGNTTAIQNKKVLMRTHHKTPQSELPRTERLENVKDVFSIQNKRAHEIRGKHIIIVDDVTTTGATLQSAKAALAKCKPASITLLALAH